jgi:RHS repeat-associated protein
LTEEQVKDSHGNLLQDEKFTYDVNNNRIGVMLNGVQQLWTVFDGANPYMDFNGSGQLTQRYLTNPKGLSQFYGQVSASGATQWFLTDNLYSIRQVVDASGNSLYAVTYGPFGGILSQTNPANAPRFGYAGGAYDPVTGTWQFGRREENPADGRWLSQDPEGFTAGDDNLYRYVLNNFVSLRDPSGQDISIVVGNSGGTSNKLFHEDICVDTWELRDGTYVNTGKICFSFAKKTGLSSYSIHCGTTWLDSPSVKFCIWTGIVYSSSWSGKGTIHEVLHTSAGQDIEFLEYLQGLVGKEDGYSLLRHSCQTFSEQMYDEAKRRYGGVRGMPHDAELDPSLWDPSLQQFRIL